MDRRKFIKLASTGAVSMAGALSVKAQASKAVPAQPNFLFFIADDLTYRAIHMFNEEVQTPNIDRLASEGCTFTHCFHQGSWSGAVCLPSRTMLNSGLTAFHAKQGVDHVPLWGETLGNAGYDTYMCGKWHLSDANLVRSFKKMGPVAPGFLPSTNDMYDRPNAGNHWQPWDESLRGHWLHTDRPYNKWPNWISQKPDTIEHSSVLYADSAIAYLRTRSGKTQQPFFTYVGFNAPHDPRQSSKEFLELYPQDKIQIPPNFLPQHPFDLGDFHMRDEMLAPFPRTHAAVQLHRREYCSIITHMDRQIGRVLDELDKTGERDNTYIVFTADHGLAVGEHGLLGKGNLYDCSIRMPFIIVGPGISAARKVNELVYQHSLYATTCALAGIATPQHVGFPSLVPLLRGGNSPVHDAVFSYYRHFQRSVRTKSHKLIFYPQIQRTQVFDLESDPWEMHDLSDDASAVPVKESLTRRLRQFHRELDDPLNLKNPIHESDQNFVDDNGKRDGHSGFERNES